MEPKEQWTQLGRNVQECHSAAQHLRERATEFAAALQRFIQATGTHNTSQPDERRVHKMQDSISHVLMPSFEEAMQTTLEQPLRQVQAALGETEQKLKLRNVAEKEYEAAQRGLMAIASRADPTRGSRLMRRLRGNAGDHTHDRGDQDTARSDAVERLATAQATVEALDQLLDEQIHSWLEHEDSLHAAIAARAEACVQGLLGGLSALADDWTRPQHLGRAEEAPDASTTPSDAATADRLASCLRRLQHQTPADESPDDWWLPRSLRGGERATASLVRVHIRGRDVRDPPLFPTGLCPKPPLAGAESFPSSSSSSSSASPKTAAAAEAAKAAAADPATDSALRHARMPDEDLGIKPTNPTPSTANDSSTTAAPAIVFAERKTPSSSTTNARKGKPVGLELVRRVAGSRTSGLLRGPRDHDRDVLVMDEDTASDSEVGTHIFAAMQRGEASCVGIAAPPESASSSLCLPAMRVLMRRRWVRRFAQGLGLQDLTSMSQVCRRWRHIFTSDQNLWTTCLWQGAAEAHSQLRPQFWLWVMGATPLPPPAWSRSRGVVFLPSDVHGHPESATLGEKRHAQDAAAAESSPDEEPSMQATSAGRDRPTSRSPDGWALSTMASCSLEEYSALRRAAQAEHEVRMEDTGEGSSMTWASTLQQDVRRTPGCIPGTAFGQLPGRRKLLLSSLGPGISIGGRWAMRPSPTRLSSSNHGDEPAPPASASDDSRSHTPDSTTGDELRMTVEAELAAEHIDASLSGHDDEEGPRDGYGGRAPGSSETVKTDTPPSLHGDAQSRQDSVLGLLLVSGMAFRVGYVQGMNHIANALIEHCGVTSSMPASRASDAAEAGEPASSSAIIAEARAFAVLRQVMDGRGLESLLQKDMTLLGALLYQLDALIKEDLPDLYEVFRTEGITPSMFAGGWVLSLFSSHRVLPPRLSARMWDAFLAGGWTEVFKAVVAVLVVLEPALLQLADIAKEDDAVMEAVLPVLQSPRSFMRDVGEGDMSSADRTLCTEPEFERAVACEAAMMRLPEARLRALASAFAAKRARPPRQGASALRSAVGARVAAIRRRFRRASSAKFVQAMAARSSRGAT